MERVRFTRPVSGISAAPVPSWIVFVHGVKLHTRAGFIEWNCAQWIFFVRLILINDKNCVSVLFAIGWTWSPHTAWGLAQTQAHRCECIISKWQQWSELRSTVSMEPNVNIGCAEKANYDALCVGALVYLRRQTTRSRPHDSLRFSFVREF